MGLSSLETVRSCQALVSSTASQGRRSKQLWDHGRLASCCCGGAGLTTPGNSQRKPPGWAPRACRAAWAQHRDIFSRVLGRLLALSRPPESPSTSPTEWRGWVGWGWGVLIYFLALEPAILPAPHLPPGQRTMGRPQTGLPGTAGVSRVDGHWPHSSRLRLFGTGSPDCTLCFQTAA